MGMVGLSSPWVSYYHELKAFFAEDPEIKIGFDNDAPEVKVFVDNDDKAEALAEVLPQSKNFGNVSLKISIIPANSKKTKRTDGEDLLHRVFKNNEAVEEIKVIDYYGAYKFTYVIFKNVVVQYWNDNLADANGLISTLYEDLAKHIIPAGAFGEVSYCTAPAVKGVNSPLGEWP